MSQFDKTEKELKRMEEAEEYIRSLRWSPQATEHEKALVAGNIRSYHAHVWAENATLRQRAERAEAEVERLTFENVALRNRIEQIEHPSTYTSAALTPEGRA